MKQYSIRTFMASDVNAVVDLQTAYSKLYPDASAFPGELYLSPGFEHGQNVFCAFDASEKLVGYAPLFPVLMRDKSKLPHTLWTEIKTYPEISQDAQLEIKNQLFEQIMIRAREVTKPFPGHPIHFMFQYFTSEIASIEYVTSKGCEYTESVFTMRRDLSLDIPHFSVPTGIDIRPWCMESEAEQQMYVDVRNACFPESPIALGEWQYFMQSPQWSVGTTMAAFCDDQLVGNVAVYWDEAENEKSGEQIGYTEYIFVLPAWRGKKLARTLITKGMRCLKEHGLTEAHLEVRAQNQNALSLYTQLGYEVIGESRFYRLILT